MKISLIQIMKSELRMTEGEEYIKEFFEIKKIQYKSQQPINGLINDSKSHRVADFYLPKYKIYVEFFGQWNVENQKERYREKRKVYWDNKIPCVLLYPENLGILDYIFEHRMIYILKFYKLKSELRRYRYKIFRHDISQNIIYLVFGIAMVFLSYPWKKDRLWLISGCSIVAYQLYLFIRHYHKLFKD